MATTKAEIQITAKDAASRVIGQVKNSLGDLDKRTTALTRTLGGLAGPLASLGGLVSVAGIAAAVKSTADYADGLGKLAQSAGVTSKSMSELAYAAELSGASQQEVAKGLQKIGLDAAQGGKKLGEFGIAVRDNAGNLKASDVLLAEFADRLAAMGSPSERSAAAIALLGEEGANLVPLLSGGSSALKDMADEAARFGKVVTDDAAKKAAEFNDNITRLTAAADGLKLQIGNALLPELTRLSNELLTGMRHANGFADALFTFGTMAPMDNASEGLAKYRKELDNLVASRAAYIKVAGSAASRQNIEQFDADIATAQKRINYLKDLQRQAVQISANDQSSAEARRLGLAAPVRPQISGGSVVRAKAAGGSAAKSEVSELTEEARAYEQALQAIGRAQVSALMSTEQLTSTQQMLVDLMGSSVFQQMPAAWQDVVTEQAKSAIELEKQAIANQKVAELAKDLRTEYERVVDAIDEVTGVLGESEQNAELLQRALDRIAVTTMPQTAEEAERLAQALGDAGASAGAIGKMKLNFTSSELPQQIAEYKAFIDSVNNLGNAMISARKKSGFFTDMEEMRAQGILNRNRIEHLNEYRAAIESLGPAMGMSATAIQTALNNIDAEIQGLLAELDPLANKFREVFEDAFAGGFEDLLNGTKSFGEAFKSIFDDIFKEINKMVAREISQGFMKMLGDGLQLGGGTGLFGWLSNLFQPYPSGGNGSTVGMLDAMFYGGGRASGGPVAPNGLYRVNEVGPELLSVGGRDYLMMGKQPGTVTPNSRLGGSAVQNINISVAMPNSGRRETALQFGADVAKQLRIAGMRNG